MGASTVAAIVDETVNVLWEELQPEHMPVPTVELFKRVAEDFMETWNFPNCVGALDGKHVRVKCPPNSGSMYYNYKKFFSIVLQAVVDARYKFLVIDVGGYGKQSDGGTFQASELYRALVGNRLRLPEPSPLPNSNFMAPFVFLADEAYPLLPYLMKPFSGTNLQPDYDNFNKRLSRARKTVECAFGILNSKWTILGKCIETRPELADMIIKCVCALHNTIIDKEGMPQNLTDVSVTMPTTVWEHVGRPTNSARDIRELFSAYFAHHPLVYEV